MVESVLEFENSLASNLKYEPVVAPKPEPLAEVLLEFINKYRTN